MVIATVEQIESFNLYLSMHSLFIGMKLTIPNIIIDKDCSFFRFLRQGHSYMFIHLFIITILN
jgi:hypothetical protein